MLGIIEKKISLKLTLALMICLLVTFAGTGWYLIDIQRQALEQTFLEKGQMAALAGARAFSAYLNGLVDRGVFSMEELFDDNYQRITTGKLAGSAIPKYHTIYDRYLDQKIRSVEDAFLVDKMVVFAVLVDRNGYLPTHNTRYSQPLTGDAEIDLKGNRTKRIFADPVGLAAAKYRGNGENVVFKQIYQRDTGALMWDLSSPVTVHGKHWGAFRIGYSMEATEASVARFRQTLLIMVSVAMLLCVVSVTILVHRLTRPLKLLTKSAQAISSGRSEQRIELRSADEIGVLVDSFNQMSEALKHTTVSRDFYDRLVHSMHDLLIVVDPQGTVVSVNRASCDVLGFAEEELRGKQVQELVVLNENSADWFSRVQGDGQNFTADVQLLDRQEKLVPVAMSCSPMCDGDDQLGGFILLFRNNSERIKAEQAKEKAYEQAFLLNQDLREANKQLEESHVELADAYKQLKNSQVQVLQQEKMASIGQLAAGVAHEINNPIGFITSNLGSLDKYLVRLQQFIQLQEQLLHSNISAEEQQQLAGQRKALKIDYLLEDGSDLIEESLDGAMRVKTIVQNLKTFSRVDQEQEAEADLNECLESTISIVWNELKYKVELEKDFGDLPLLRCYPQKLNQVFMNILINASQALEEKGGIKIRTWCDGEQIYVAISDNGCGIPEENLGRIFEPFYTTKEVGKGTGLGMSISYEIVQGHGGDIQVASVVGEGTTFTISLPLRHNS